MHMSHLLPSRSQYHEMQSGPGMFPAGMVYANGMMQAGSMPHPNGRNSAGGAALPPSAGPGPQMGMVPGYGFSPVGYPPGGWPYPPSPMMHGVQQGPGEATWCLAWLLACLGAVHSVVRACVVFGAAGGSASDGLLVRIFVTAYLSWRR